MPDPNIIPPHIEQALERTSDDDRLIAIEQRLTALEDELLPLVKALAAPRKRRDENSGLG